ncbi:MAG: HAD-IC family P-type ATPase [Candidatus Heimdallarchaeota archaeon]|nr:HAD-IC family P-type ATPase [Candidatus Heimdallarchaeota archaeon]
MTQWHTLQISNIVEKLDSDEQKGLTRNQVEQKKKEFGLNKLPEAQRKSRVKILINQFNDILIYILIFAALATMVLGIINQEGRALSMEYFFDTFVIVIVLIINAAIGYNQEVKAEKAVRSLQGMVSESASVIRNGEMHVIDSHQLVPGDIVIFNPGERIPADLRLIETFKVSINESSLTGESLPVKKQANMTMAEESSLGDRKNMAYMGTIVTSGSGRGMVVATGEQTEVGKISMMVSRIEDFQTPLQRKLHEFSNTLAKWILSISMIIIIVGVIIELQHLNEPEFLLEAILGLVIIGVSLAVAAIPEGLPIILTFSLAISVQKMAKQNSIIRNLEAVETLGSTTFIATDKTGTLTQNKLTLMKLITRDKEVDMYNHEAIDSKHVDKIKEIMAITTSKIRQLVLSGEEMAGKVDPLDEAIVNSLEHDSVNIEKYKVLWEYPFDSDRKLMSVVYQEEGRQMLALKGAPDVVLDRSTLVLQEDGSYASLTEEIKNQYLEILQSLAKHGYRVVATGFRLLDNIDSEEESEKVERELIFAGFMTFIDPPRPEVFESIEKCHQAGINVVMITGDHPDTAFSIAKELNIANDKFNAVCTGKELDSMSDEMLKESLKSTRVFARVTPEHKLRLVNLLQDQGEIVGMTGDGVNDSPALVKADIGVAMGITGTDAAKESADMILLDDNFTTMVKAVEEGRVVNDNIRKFTHYLLASNTSEVLYILMGFFIVAALKPIMIRQLLPITETQILYLNLVTDSFLALALALEKKERDVMQSNPMPPDTPIITRQAAIRIASIGILIATVSVVIFFYLLGPYQQWSALSKDEIAYAQSYTLTFLVISETLAAVSYRSKQPIHKIGYMKNKYFIISIIIIILAHLSILYIPVFHLLLHTVPLSGTDWIGIIVLSSVVFALLEWSKKYTFKQKKSKF